MCFPNEKNRGDLKSCVYHVRIYNILYIMYQYFIDLFWITADSPTLFSESEDFDTSKRKTVAVVISQNPPSP